MRALSHADSRLKIGLFALALLVQGCRSNSQTNGKGSTSTTGAIASVPMSPLTDDGGYPYRVPPTQRDEEATRRNALDGGLSLLNPIALREDSRLPADTLNSREAVGLSLDVDWKASDWPAPSNAPETDREHLNELRSATRWSMRVDLATSGRMRLLLRNRGFALDNGTEFRSRVDLLGHLLVWPNESQYRPLVPGSLRQMLEEGRADVGELLTISGKPLGNGHWLEWDTERVETSTVFGRIVIERADNLVAGVAGRLLCRWLIELINGDPLSEVCQDDAVPLRVNFEFPHGGKGEFIVTRVVKKQEFSSASLSVPPVSATPMLRAVPRNAPLSGASLASMRSRAMPPGPAHTTPVPAGLIATNHSLGLRALLIDGVIAAWLWPGDELSIPDLPSGVYAIAWRDFMGMARQAPTSVTLPAHVSIGNAP